MRCTVSKILKFDKECLRILDKRKQNKIQLARDQNQSSVDNTKNVRREGSIHFGGEGGGKKEHLKAEIEELETKSKIKKNIRDLYMGIKGYQLRTNIVKDKKSDLVRLSQYYG